MLAVGIPNKLEPRFLPLTIFPVITNGLGNNIKESEIDSCIASSDGKGVMVVVLY